MRKLFRRVNVVGSEFFFGRDNAPYSNKASTHSHEARLSAARVSVFADPFSLLCELLPHDRLPFKKPIPVTDLLFMTITKLLPFVVLSNLFLSGCMGINQLQPAPIGSHVEDAPSPSGKHLNKENDPSTKGG